MNCFSFRPFAAREVAGYYNGTFVYSDPGKKLHDDEKYGEEEMSVMRKELLN